MVGGVPRIHPLLDEDIRRAVERAASDYLGERWTCRSFTDLNDQASHPAGVLHGHAFGVCEARPWCRHGGAVHVRATRPRLRARRGWGSHPDADREWLGRAPVRLPAAVR